LPVPDRFVRRPVAALLCAALFLLPLRSGDVQAQPPTQAGGCARRQKDRACLEATYRALYTGMARSDVERLLGEPDYSPLEGLYYYASHQREASADGGRRATLTLIVDYRNEQSVPTDTLHAFRLDAVGE
jgi:hypothetical protein